MTCPVAKAAARLERVQEPQLDRVDLERGRELVHLRLGREARLHRAEPAHRAARRVVRVHDETLDPHVLDRVRPDRERARVRDHRRRARRVRAAVDQDPHPHGDELARPRRAVLGPDPRRVPVDVADERLLAVVDHLHRAARAQREHRRVDLHREVLAAAERAADAGEVDPHLLGREAEAGRDLVAVDVQPLRRDVDVDAALAVRDRDARLRAEERLVLLADLVDAGDRDVRRRVRVAAPDDERADDVRPRVVAVAVPHRRAVRMERLRLGRALGVDDRLERLVLDAHGRGRAPRLLRLLGGDDRDRLAEVAHAVDREHGLVGELEPVRLLAGDVLVREHGVDAGHRDRLGDVDRDDPRVRVRAADGVAPEHPGGVQVARVRELARDLRDRVAALPCWRRVPDRKRSAGPNVGVTRHRPAARCTASRIFW